MAEIRKVGVAGTGSYVPARILSNFDLEEMVDTSDEWITTRTGIRERRIAREDEACSDLALEAVRRALDDAKTSPEELDLLIVATITADKLLPSAACYLQEKIGAKNAACFDLVAACSGFIYGMASGWQFVGGGMMDKVAVVGSEVLSRITDYEDRKSCILFGDGAGAAILAPAREGYGEILYSHLAADGSGAELMQTPAGGSLKPASHETVEGREHFMRIQGKEVFKFAVETMRRLVADAMEQCNLKTEDVKLVVPHQVNSRIIESAVKKLDIPLERVYMNIDRYGNTSAASVPIALDEARKEGLVGSGDHVILVSFGGGLTWASMVMRW
jgi:3-oxoacyl-[acyl-carrier-protein] synthase-3